jgi:hypothetical protein
VPVDTLLEEVRFAIGVVVFSKDSLCFVGGPLQQSTLGALRYFCLDLSRIVVFVVLATVMGL